VAAGKRRQLHEADLSARVLEELRRIAFLDPRRFYYPSGHPQAGQLMQVPEMDEEVRGCLAIFKVTRASPTNSDKTRVEERLFEIKPCDKLKALEMLAKHFALLKESVTVTTDWNKLAARLASARTEPIDPKEFLGPRKVAG
jgi:hypothetical protein